MAWVCPLCSTANEDDFAECMVCGQERILCEPAPAVSGSSWGAALARAAARTTSTTVETARPSRSWGAALGATAERREEPAPHSWSAALARAASSGTAPHSTESAAVRLARALASSDGE